VTSGSIPRQSGRESEDVVYLHAAAIARGLKCLVGPSGMLIVEPDSRDSSVCIAQGVAPTTSQATAALLNEQDVVRVLLSQRGIETPESHRHIISDGVVAAVAAAQSLGFPLVVRPAWTNQRASTPARSFFARDENELIQAVERLESAAGWRADRVRRPHARLLIERASSAEIQALVVDGKVVAATRRSVRPARRRSWSRLDIESLRPRLTDTAVTSAAQIPDLPVATVYLATDEAAEEPEHAQRFAVIGIDPYPRLAVHERAATGSAVELAMILLEHALPEAAVRHLPTSDRISAQVRMVGLSSAYAALPDISAHRQDRDLAGHLDVESDADGILHGWVEGTSHSVATFVRSVISGQAGKARPLYVETFWA
jgi:hypothetical protein